MADSRILAEQVSDRLLRISDRARKLALGVGLLAALAGMFAYVVGFLVIPSDFRLVWAIAGLLLCLAPLTALLTAIRRLNRIRRTVPETANELRGFVSNTEIRRALVEVTDRSDDYESKTPLIALGKDLLALRSAVAKHKDQLANAWKAVTALMSLPGLVAIGIVGSLSLLVLSAIAIVVRIALLN